VRSAGRKEKAYRGTAKSSACARNGLADVMRIPETGGFGRRHRGNALERGGAARMRP